MLKKNKKFTLLLSGLSGALLVSSAAGVALSSCTTSSSSTPSTDVQYSYVIDWNDKNIVDRLIIDNNGLVYSDNSETTIIAVSPKVNLTTVKIPSKVKSIMGYSRVMYQKISDSSIVDQIPSGESVDSYIKVYQSYGAFQNMASLENVILETGSELQSIGGLAFSGCNTLKSITGLSNSLTFVGTNAFANCTNLQSFNTSNVVKVGNNAFLNCTSLSSIDLNSAIYIGDNAFQNCVNLSTVDFSKNTTLTSIGVSAFAGAMTTGSSTVKIDLSNVSLLRVIPNNAFQGCTNLGAVVLSATNNLVAIGTNAFSGATSLTQVGPTANTFTAPTLLGNYAANVTSAYVTGGIGSNAFNGTKIVTIDLSAVTATTPFTNASFKNMTTLTTVNFGSNSKITTIPYSLFEGTSALTSLTLPASITTINDGANNPTTTPSTDADNRSPFYNSGLQSIDMSAITSYATETTSWNNVTIQNTTMLPKGLFQGLTRLTSVVLKTGTVVIGENAFDGASALTTVKENVTSTIAGEIATTGLIISSTLGMINTNAFKGTAIPTVSFVNETGNSLWFIGQGSFQNTTALTTVDLSKADTTTSHSISFTAYGSTNTNNSTGPGLYSISSNAFNGATKLATIKLPTSIATIYGSAFVNNTTLSSVNFNELTGLSNILSNNFTGASALSSIDLTANTTASSLSYLSSSTSIFTGLPTGATVKLPASANSLQDSSFLIGNTTNHAGIIYPNGVNLNIVTSTDSTAYKYIGSGSSSNTNSNPTLQYASGTLDLTATNGGNEIQRYYGYTFFGNTNLTSLTMSASGLSSGSSGTETQATTLFMNRTVSSSDTNVNYQYDYVPFGNNTALTSFIFKGFDINSSPTYPDAASQLNREKIEANPLYKTTTKTWAQVSTIINKFASNTLTTITTWPSITTDGQAPDGNNIQKDSIFTGAQSTEASSLGYKLTTTNSSSIGADGSSSGNSETLTFTFTNALGSEDAKTWSFIHNGVTWTMTIVPKTASAEGSVTLVGTNINVYKATNDAASVANQIPFATTTTGENTTANKITVTLKIV